MFSHLFLVITGQWQYRDGLWQNLHSGRRGRGTIFKWDCSNGRREQSMTVPSFFWRYIIYCTVSKIHHLVIYPVKFFSQSIDEHLFLFFFSRRSSSCQLWVLGIFCPMTQKQLSSVLPLVFVFNSVHKMMCFANW